MLCEYSGTHHPGQPRSSYRFVKHDEIDKDENLRQKLKNPLTPSTTQAELSSIPRKCHCALYLMGLLIASTLSSANGSAGCDGAVVMRTQLCQTGWSTWDILAVIGILSLMHIFIKVARIANLLFNRVIAVLENAN